MLQGTGEGAEAQAENKRSGHGNAMVKMILGENPKHVTWIWTWIWACTWIYTKKHAFPIGFLNCLIVTLKKPQVFFIFSLKSSDLA